jgi:hypothetical protein
VQQLLAQRRWLVHLKRQVPGDQVACHTGHIAMIRFEKHSVWRFVSVP